MPGLPPAFRSIPDGQDLLEAFADSFAASAGWVFATGFVEDVELRLVAAGADTRRALSGRYVLAQLSGPLTGPYGVTLSRLEGGRVELVAGILVRARSAGVNACCLSANAELMLAMPPSAAEGPAAPVATAPAATGSPRWAAQVNAAAAARLAEKEPAAEVEEPERGDLVQHFAFGVCEVLSVTGDRLLIRDLSRTGRVLEIHVDMLVVHPPVERDGKRMFRLSRRG